MNTFKMITENLASISQNNASLSEMDLGIQNVKDSLEILLDLRNAESGGCCASGTCS